MQPHSEGPKPYPEAVAPYYNSLRGTHAETLLAMRDSVLAVAPDAVEIIKYGMPTFVSGGIVILGLLSNKNHIGYYPYSSRILIQFPDELAGYKTTPGALHVPLGMPLETELIAKLIEARKRLED